MGLLNIKVSWFVFFSHIEGHFLNRYISFICCTNFGGQNRLVFVYAMSFMVQILSLSELNPHRAVHYFYKYKALQEEAQLIWWIVAFLSLRWCYRSSHTACFEIQNTIHKEDADFRGEFSSQLPVTGAEGLKRKWNMSKWEHLPS